MMKKLVLCVALGLAALCGAWAVGWIGLPFSSENRDARLSLQASHPANWNEDDVSRWLNVTVRYPEYHAAFAANGVDGPTLFYLTEADFGHLGVKHPVHRAKLLAHLDVLRGRCVCTPPTTPDFWAYLQTNTYRVMYLGALFEYSPRLGFCYIGYFEWEMLSDVLGLFGLSGYAVVSVAALLMLAAPHAVLTVVGARLLLPANYVLAVAYMLSHVSKALTDGREVLALLPELLVPRHSLQLWWNFLMNVSDTRKMWVLETCFPLAFIILGPVFPYYGSLLLAYVYIAYHAVLNGIFWTEKAVKSYQDWKGTSSGA